MAFSLESEGAQVSFYDPYIPEYKQNGVLHKGIAVLSQQLLESADVVVITAAHTNVDYDLVGQYARCIFDTKNVMKDSVYRENVEVL